MKNILLAFSILVLFYASKACAYTNISFIAGHAFDAISSTQIDIPLTLEYMSPGLSACLTGNVADDTQSEFNVASWNLSDPSDCGSKPLWSDIQTYAPMAIAEYNSVASAANYIISQQYAYQVPSVSSSLSTLTSSFSALSSNVGAGSLSTVAHSGSYSDLSNKPSLMTVYNGYTAVTSPKTFTSSGTVSSGTVIFQLTADGTSTGTALFLSGPITSSLNWFVNSASTLYLANPVWSNSNKTLTLTVNSATSSGVISLLGLSLLGAPVAAANGTVVNISMFGY